MTQRGLPCLLIMAALSVSVTAAPDASDLEATWATYVPGYRLQLHATSNEETALSLADAAKPFFDEKIHVVYEKPFFKVQVGNFTDRADATRLLEQAVDSGYNPVWIVSTLVPDEPNEFADVSTEIITVPDTDLADLSETGALEITPLASPEMEPIAETFSSGISIDDVSIATPAQEPVLETVTTVEESMIPETRASSSPAPAIEPAAGPGRERDR